MHSKRDHFSAIGRDKSGNFGIILALLMAPIALAMGTAIDYGYALSVRTEMQSAADIAAVQALSEQSAGVIAALTQSLSGELQLAETDAGYLFEANLQKMSKDYLNSKEINIVRTGDTFVSTVSFKATVPTSFLGMFGVRKIEVAGIAKGVYVPASYIDFHLMLDNSPSMGLGATTADIAKLEANTPDKCAFACHETTKADNYYKLAKSLGVMTRIELVSEAAQKMMETAEDTRRHKDQYRMAVYSMGAKAEEPALTNVAELSSNLDTVKTNTKKIDLMSIPKQNYKQDQMTDLLTNLTALKDSMGKSGSGMNSGDRKKVLFLVSDGVEDVYRPIGCIRAPISSGDNKGRCQAPLDSSICQKIKENGVSIAVLYTTYHPIERDGWYNKHIKPFRPDIGTHMKACASEGLFFEVSPSQGIDEAMNALFMKVVNMPRLTQ
ncbi:pilus assembly protein [Rhizobium sp. TH2]|uniref:TadE/TadG family type IV pilus assembly protein n=1 Tax=Rhizobium sp. TH2 TaxID=2775403 RepID=UPI0021579841|nr:TadE/TadG family type IV pilus assembly protein [Rhizobium sp. TH2]UVC10678.1 pilus assembly protein [Rhizobium sp. TH2]